jgi:hypothetical protein
MQEEIKKEFLQDELTEEIVAKLADCPIDHLELVYKLSMKADLTFNNLANLTTYVPNLKDLRLNGSIVIYFNQNNDINNNNYIMIIINDNLIIN